jgi:hypothetical protein
LKNINCDSGIFMMIQAEPGFAAYITSEEIRGTAGDAGVVEGSPIKMEYSEEEKIKDMCLSEIQNAIESREEKRMVNCGKGR